MNFFVIEINSWSQLGFYILAILHETTPFFLQLNCFLYRYHFFFKLSVVIDCFIMVQAKHQGLLVTNTNSCYVQYITLHTYLLIFYRVFKLVLGGHNK